MREVQEQSRLRSFEKSSPWFCHMACYTEDECHEMGLVKGNSEVVVAVLGEGWVEREAPPVIEMASRARHVAFIEDFRRAAARRVPEGGDTWPWLAGWPAADDEEQLQVNLSRPGGVNEVQAVGGAEDIEEAGGLGIGLFDAVAEQGSDKRGLFGHVKRFLRRKGAGGDSSSVDGAVELLP